MPSQAINNYLVHYHGTNDWHLYAFRLIAARFAPTRVLYPGSWIHVTPSLVFSSVIYIDLSATIEREFQDVALRQYLNDNAEYLQQPWFKFYRADYRRDLGLDDVSFDLILSLSAGLISRDCRHYLKRRGYLLVNNEHHDASMAYVDPSYALIGVFPTGTRYSEAPSTIQRYFHTTKNAPITHDMITENIQRPPSKAKYKLK